MTITVEIRPEVEAELTRQAVEHDCRVETLAAVLLEESAHRPPQLLSHRLTKKEGSGAERPATLMELFAPIRGLLTDEEIDTLFIRNRSRS